MGALGVLLISAATLLPPWQGLEERAQANTLGEYRRRLHPSVLMLVADEPTYRSAEWNGMRRAAYGRMTAAIEAAGAKAISYDLFFSNPSMFGAEDDQAFKDALAPLRRVIFAAECALPMPGADNRNPSALPPGPLPAGHCERLALPHDGLRDVAPTAHIQINNSASGLFHSIFLFAESDSRPNERLPHLALAALAAGDGLHPRAIAQGEDGVRIGERFIPSSSGGTFRVSSSWPHPDSVVSMVDVIRAVSKEGPPTLRPEMAARLKDRYVVVGRSAESLGDWGTLADGTRGPMMLVHVTALSDMLYGKATYTLPTVLHPLLAALVGLLLVVAALNLRTQLAGAALLVLLTATWGLVGEGIRRGIVFPPLGPSMAAVAGFAFAVWGRSAARERERQLLESAFGAYVDRSVMNRILENPAQYLALGGAKRRATILFADISGYTALTNERPAEEVIAFMRDYLEVMTVVIRERGGRIDKIMGDGIMAVFGDPEPHRDHAARATDTALTMHARMTEQNRRWKERGWPELRIRVGIATGEVFVGNIGAPGAKLEYTALGATVNLASRLEGQAQPGSVLISEETRRDVGELFSVRPTELKLKGFTGGVTAYVLEGRAAAA